MLRATGRHAAEGLQEGLTGTTPAYGRGAKRRARCPACCKGSRAHSDPTSHDLAEQRCLRRTFATLLYAIGETPPGVMAEMGGTHPGLALRIYAQAIRRNPDEAKRLNALVNGQWALNGHLGALEAPPVTQRTAA